MKRVLSAAMALVMFQSLWAQQGAVVPTQSSGSGATVDLGKVKPGKLVTLILAGGKQVKGTVVARSESQVELRVDRGWFRTRPESVPVAEIQAVKTHTPEWVPVVIIGGVVAGVVIAVAACVSSGACSS